MKEKELSINDLGGGVKYRVRKYDVSEFEFTSVFTSLHFYKLKS